MKKQISRVISFVLALAMVVTLCPQTQLKSVKAADEDPYCISVGRPVYASSDNGSPAENAVDGNDSTRWQAANDDENEWFYVDLGTVANVDYITIAWEAAYAKSYVIEFSDDEENWREVYSRGNVSSGSDTQQSVGDIKIKAGAAHENSNGTISSNLSWDSVSNAVTYKIYVDEVDAEHVATAPDGYTFDKDNRLDLQNDVKLLEGTHTYIVIAYDANGAEIARGEIELSDDLNAGTSADEEEDDEDDDSLTHVINFDSLSTSEKQARYVKITVKERALSNYGCSMYEFQVYGTGGVVKRPADYGENLALNKTVTCSGTRDEWWMYDENGNMKEDSYNEVKPENAVDGDASTSFTSYQDTDQWITVDLGAQYTIGRITIDWTTDAGKIYDVQVSSNGSDWTTAYRVLRGYASRKDNFTIYYTGVRYVRIWGYTQVESGSGFGIYELSVYEYKDGDSKDNPSIPALPEWQLVENQNGSGTYVTGDMYNEKNKLPTFVNEDNITSPVDSNSWWTSAMVQQYSNLLCVNPLKAGYSTKGLGVLLATAGWVGTRTENDLGTDQSNETNRDFYISPENFDSSTGYDRVEDYGDYSVEIALMDEDGMQMKMTMAEGSPYIYSEYCDNDVIFITSTTIEEIYDGNKNVILESTGDSVTTDHIAFKSFDSENTKSGNDGSYFCVNVPAGTTFKKMVSGSTQKIKITFPSTSENYMSIAGMNDMSSLDTYYQHGYAFVTDTSVSYDYDASTSKIETVYTVTTKTKRSGYSDVTMQALYPHEWKHSNDALVPAATYPSIRGDMKAIWSNTFKTTQQFAGLLPTFAKADSDMMDTAEMEEYLQEVVANKVNTTPVDDAYWEGKNVHPLAISAIMADELGETEIKEQLLAKLKSIMVDWFNYDGEDDSCYFIYNKDWGTIYYPNSAYGANAAICDHHFTYGYFMFGAAVLAAYDKDFLNEYKDMIELLVRDYADPYEPEDDGDMFCKFRTFDQYAGHSWAGGYADSDSGNNQESASEALFSWVGMYLWGEVTQNEAYIDAGAYGFTTEMDAVEQYWFDYDETNWLEDYPFQATGQVYGASMGYGTYFGGQPVYVYGIQWLPISEYLTNYGMDQEKCAKIYQGLWDDTNYAIAIEKRLGNITDDNEYVTPDNGWQHITWPFLSQTDPDSAYDLFEKNVSSVQTEDRANTLWFISAMDQLGYRTNDYSVVGNITGSVYVKDTENGKAYTAEVWNPLSTTQTVTIIDSNGNKAGTASIGAGALVSFAIDTENQFELTQVSTPKIKSTGISDGIVTNNLSGTVEFDDTQFIELSCEEEGVDIYYTTDGEVPTTDSTKYDGRILVSSDTTIKAIAVKDGCIDSAYASVVIVINGDEIQGSDNLALHKPTTASTEDGGNVASNATDGSLSTRWQASGSEAGDKTYLQVDLEAVYAINTVKIYWEAAYASKYEIEVSLDGEEWTTVATENGMAGWVESVFPAVNARYVRMQSDAKGTTYGDSIYEMEVYGALQADAPIINPVSGIYDTPQTVTMETTVKGAEIKYTLDGSEPNEDSTSYTEPFTVSESTIVKASTYRKGMLMSDVVESDIVIAGTLTLNETDIRVAIGNTFQLSAITDEDVTWTTSNASVATVDKNGLVTGIAEGSAVITAAIENGHTATCTVTVTQPIHISSISMQSTLEMKINTSYTLDVDITPSDTTDDTTVTWSSSDENVVTVTSGGTVTAKGIGEATITAKVGDYTATCKVTVTRASYTEMVSSDKYNLALNKNVIISSIYSGEGSQDASTLVNGDLTDLYVSTEWDRSNTSEYIIIDLGAEYNTDGIDQILLQFKDTDLTFCESYEIQFSTDGENYVTVATATATYADSDNGLYVIDIDDASDLIEATRYVKIVLNGHKDYGYQIREVAVLSSLQNAYIVGESTETTTVDTATTTQTVTTADTSTTTNAESTTNETTKESTSADEQTTTKASSTTPLAPAGLVYSGNDNLPIYFSWQASEGAISYNVYVDGTLIANVTGTSFNGAGYESYFTEGKTVTIAVTSLGEDGSESEPAQITWTVPKSSDDDSDAPDEHKNFDMDSVTWKVLDTHGGTTDHTYYISEGSGLGTFYWGIYVEHGDSLPYHDQRSNCVIGDENTVFSVCENDVSGVWINGAYYDNHTELFNRDGDCVEIAVEAFSKEYNVVTLVYSNGSMKTFAIRVEEPLGADATEPKDQEYIDPASITDWTQIGNTTVRGSKVYVPTYMIDDKMFGTRNLWGVYATASASAHYNIDDSYGIWDVPVIAMTSSGSASAVIIDGLDYINATDPEDKLVCIASDCVYIAQELVDDAYIGGDTYHTITFEDSNTGTFLMKVTNDSVEAGDTTTKEPDTTTKEPDTTTKEPDTTTQEPDTTTKEPDTTTQEPDTTTKEPDTTTKEPDTTTKEPDTTTKEPDTTTKEPDTTTKEPDTTTKYDGSNAPDEHKDFDIDSVEWDVLDVKSDDSHPKANYSYYINSNNTLDRTVWYAVYTDHANTAAYHGERTNCIIGEENTAFIFKQSGASNINGVWINSVYYDNPSAMFNGQGDCVEIAVDELDEEYNVITLDDGNNTTFAIRVEEPLGADATMPKNQEYIDPSSITDWTQVGSTSVRGSKIYVPTYMIDDGMFGSRGLWGVYATASASAHYNIDDSYGIWDVPVIAMTSSGNASAVIIDGLDYINATDPEDKLVCIASDCVYIAQELVDDAYIGSDTYHTITFEGSNTGTFLMKVTNDNVKAPAVDVPSSPSGLQYAGTDENPLYFVWDSDEDAEYYNIYVNGVLVTSTVQTSFNGADYASYFPQGERVTIEVEAVNEIGPSEKASVTFDVPVEETTTTEPDTTTKEPDTTTAEPDTTTKEPDTTTAEPDTTTKEPDTTTAEPTTKESGNVEEVPHEPEGLEYAGTDELPFYFEWADSEDADHYNIYINGQLITSTHAASFNGADYAEYFPAGEQVTIGVTAVNEYGESEMLEITFDVPAAPDGSANTTNGADNAGAVTGNTQDSATTTAGEEETLKKVVIKKVKAKQKSSKKLTVKVKKVANSTGYQVRVYKAKKKAKKNKKAILKKKVSKKKFTLKSKKLSNKSKLFVRVRAYKKTESGTKIYGKWSKVKKVKIK